MGTIYNIYMCFFSKLRQHMQLEINIHVKHLNTTFVQYNTVFDLKIETKIEHYNFSLVSSKLCLMDYINLFPDSRCGFKTCQIMMLMQNRRDF